MPRFDGWCIRIHLTPWFYPQQEYSRQERTLQISVTALYKEHSVVNQVPSSIIWLVSITLYLAFAMAAPCSGQSSQSTSTGNTAVVVQGKSDAVPIAPDILKQIRSLWNLKEARKAGFDVELLSTHTEDGYRTDEIYLTSRVTPSGPDRIFCTFSRPINPSPRVGAYIDLTGGRDLVGVNWLAHFYRCAVLDIEWRSPNLPHHTKWAKPSPAALFGLDPNLTGDFNTMFATAIMRAIDYLVTQPGIDPEKIACGGGSMGGWYSLLAAGLDPRVKCVYSAYGAGKNVANALDALTADRRQVWAAAFDPLTYAGKVKAATLFYLGTNDYFFPPDHGMAHFDGIHGEKRMLLVPNDNHDFAPFGTELPHVDKQWIDHVFRGDAAFPTVSNLVGHGRVYRWNVHGPRAIKSSTLYWSPGSPAWQARYWLALPGVARGKVWSAEVPAEFASLGGALFANGFDDEGRGSSSHIILRKGTDPAVVSGPQWPGGTLWDLERGVSAWRRPGPAHDYGLWTQELALAGTSGIKVTPTDAAGKVSVLTNSVILASGAVGKFSGILLTIDGAGTPGELSVILERKSGNPYRTASVAHVTYTAGETEVKLPWSAFKRADGVVETPYPFDGLRIDGDRTKGLPLAISRIEMW